MTENTPAREDVERALGDSFARAPFDSRPDGTGLDDGPWLPGCAPRKPMPFKTPEQFSAIRAQAWATRRAKYGKDGHR